MTRPLQTARPHRSVWQKAPFRSVADGCCKRLQFVPPARPRQAPFRSPEPPIARAGASGSAWEPRSALSASPTGLFAQSDSRPVLAPSPGQATARRP